MEKKEINWVITGVISALCLTIGLAIASPLKISYNSTQAEATSTLTIFGNMQLNSIEEGIQPIIRFNNLGIKFQATTPGEASYNFVGETNESSTAMILATNDWGTATSGLMVFYGLYPDWPNYGDVAAWSTYSLHGEAGIPLVINELGGVIGINEMSTSTATNLHIRYDKLAESLDGNPPCDDLVVGDIYHYSGGLRIVMPGECGEEKSSQMQSYQSEQETNSQSRIDKILHR